MLQIHTTESIIRSSRIAAQFVIILLIIVLWITKLILITESIVGLVAVLIRTLAHRLQILFAVISRTFYWHVRLNIC